jgi:hypothetical protein
MLDLRSFTSWPARLVFCPFARRVVRCFFETRVMPGEQADFNYITGPDASGYSFLGA